MAEAVLRCHQNGSTLTEFVVVGPLILLIALTGLQFMQMQYAKLNLGYAAFEAARAGARQHADPEYILDAWYRALVPWMVTVSAVPGYDRDEDPRLSGRIARAALKRLEGPYTRIEIINPAKEAFDDFGDARLQKILHTGQFRTIPNDDLGKRPDTPGPRSGISVQDANILKIRVTYGYKPAIPLAGKLLKEGLLLTDGAREPFKAALLAAGRIPVVVESTTPMLSPPIESGWIKPKPAPVAPGGAESGGTDSGPEVGEGPDGGGQGSDSSDNPGSGGGSTESGDLCPVGNPA